MSEVSRRDFLKLAGVLVGSLGWPLPAQAEGHPPQPAPERVIEIVADGLEELASGGGKPVVWLTGQACSGCSVSFLNTIYPDPAYLLTEAISLDFHPVLSAATGAKATEAMNLRIEAGDYLLVVEGSIPTLMPAACRVGEEDFTDLVARAARAATAVVALGTCASSGGIPAAPPNPTGAVSVGAFLGSQGISKPLVNLPGCPAHPDWLVGTLVYLLKFGTPPLTEAGSPVMFYKDVIHARCPRFYQYNMGEFARQFGEDGCLFKLGCMGIRTNADCASRRWNSKVSWCIEAGAPCLGCARPEFANDPAFPFFRFREQNDA
jgi:hydrogenase small subunit